MINSNFLEAQKTLSNDLSRFLSRTPKLPPVMPKGRLRKIQASPLGAVVDEGNLRSETGK